MNSPTIKYKSTGRDPARIPELLNALQSHWQRNPDLRLMQLLVDTARPQEPCPELFYMSDEELLERLKAEL